MEDLSHLSAEERHTRRTLDAAIERELESTEGDLERSITNYVREATKTYLNRFVALKTIEVRDLVEETITERPEYSNRSYMHHTVAEIAGELTNAPDDGFGAALDLAYQEIGAEIRMIFEESEHTAIDLDAQVREEILDELDEIDDDAWESDEALGWVYQYFGEEEREEIDKRVDEENYKIAGTDIATKTQLFTPRYIVEWMVDNSLGRTWLEMQGERTNIDDKENCFYLAPLGDSLIDRGTKAVEDITVLDPACGSGHMLFYAFDVLYQMYLEEGEIPEKYIAREILRNNLYGMDIDSGAAQIAALSLYLKAKEKSPDVEISQLNIVSADAVLINGDKKQEVLDRARSDIEKDILGQIWQSFDSIREFGSLVRVEEHINEIINQHRDAIEASGQAKFTGDGSFVTQSTFVSDDGESESWTKVKSRLLDEIADLVSEALDRDEPIEEMFAAEVEKSVYLLNIFLQDYDVVITNPPYLGSAKMGSELKQFVKDNYKGSRDLYTAFIERCGEFVGDEKYATLVTPENFMFLYSFRGLRKQLIENKQFVEGMHLSRYGFDQQKDAYTIPFLLRNSESKSFDTSRFYRMTENQEKYKNYEDKIDGLNEITRFHRQGKAHDDVYVIDQNSFKEIGRTPFVYWFGKEILNTFVENPTLGDVATVKHGLRTGDDTRFVKKYWEPTPSSLAEEYYRFQKSGTDAPYYDVPEDYLYWGDDGREVCNYDGSDASNREYFFDDGVTYRGFGNYFVARRKHKQTVFSQKAHFVKSRNYSHDALTGLLSSSLTRFIMNGINPGMDFTVGDGKRLPIKPELKYEEEIAELSRKGMQKRRELSCLQEISSDFDGDSLIQKINDGITNLLRSEDMLSGDIDVIHGLIDEKVFDEYNLDSNTQNRIYENLPKNIANQPHATNAGELNASIQGIRSEIPTKTLSEDEYEELIDDISNQKDKEHRDISEALDISPYSVAMARYKHDLYTEDEKKEAAGRLLSYYFGCAMGHWDMGEMRTENDGILVFRESFDNNVMAIIRKCIELSFQEETVGDVESELSNLLGRSVDDWLRHRFFRYHHTKEYRRRGQRIPIYWQLESPDGAFSCLIYYHSIDANTLPKLRGQYIDPYIAELENKLETLNAQSKDEKPDKELLNRKETVQNDLSDIKEFRDTIDEMIDDGVTVDVEKGIWENIKEWDQYEVLETGLPKLKSSYSR
jgi:type I restriction-modification system DNA methylase subunit